MKLLVLDANSLVNRAFFGIHLLSTRDGRYTNAIYGFLNNLLSLLEAHKPDAVAIAWDEKAPTFRHERYDGYKAGRHAMPEELAQQMPVIKELLRDLGFVQVSKEGWEADDILGTLAAACGRKGGTTLLATGDRDCLQLVSQNTTVLLSTNQQTLVMDEAATAEKYGVSPKQLIDVKSLMGDASDNIPGVPGIGEKTALNLIRAFGSLEGVYAHLDDKIVKPKQRESLKANRDKAQLSYFLGTIREDAPIQTDPEAYVRGDVNAAAALKTLRSLEMHSMAQRWGLEECAAEACKSLPVLESKPLPLKLQGRYYLGHEAAGWYAVQTGGEPALYTVCERDLPAFLESEAEIYVFDAKPLYRIALENGGAGRAIRFDGKLAAYLLNPLASKYEIEVLCKDYGASPLFTAPEYAQAGVLATLLETLANELEKNGLRALHDEMELPLARVLADMERVGFAVDAQGIRSFGESLRGELDAIRNDIYREVGYTFNLNSAKQLSAALFDTLGLPPRKKSHRDYYSTDAETLASLRPYSPVVDNILKYRTYTKLLSTYVDGLLNAVGPDGRIHSTFIQTEARTGRISSTEPNLQNIPIRTQLGSQLRGYFHAAEGKVLVDADYSQIELRILAHITGDAAMQQAFCSGADIHRSTAAKIYHIPESEVTQAQRTASKAINFGIMYGKGAYSLAKDLGVSVKAAETFLNSYMDAFPRVDEYMRGCIAEAKERGYVETLFGRRRQLPELASSNFQVRASGERMARNTPIQGTAADIIKLAMVHVWQRLQEEQLEARLLLQVHDELIVEAPEDEVAVVKALLKEEMECVVEYTVPLTVDVGVGRTWLEAH